MGDESSSQNYRREYPPHLAVRAPLQGVENLCLSLLSVWHTLWQEPRTLAPQSCIWSLIPASPNRPSPISGFGSLFFVKKSLNQLRKHSWRLTPVTEAAIINILLQSLDYLQQEKVFCFDLKSERCGQDDLYMRSSLLKSIPFHLEMYQSYIKSDYSLTAFPQLCSEVHWISVSLI